MSDCDHGHASQDRCAICLLDRLQRQVDRLHDERAAREKAETERGRALVAGAVQAHALREALRRYGRHSSSVGCPAGRILAVGVPASGTCTCGLDAALAALDGGGDVKGALCALWLNADHDGQWATMRASLDEPAWANGRHEGDCTAVAVTCNRCLVEEAEKAADAFLASPPALPDATAALAAFVRVVVEECLAEIPVSLSAGDVLRRRPALDPAALARRWLSGGGR